MRFRKCPVCQEPFQGRADKKFCTDHCRNDHHNRRLANVGREFRATNKILYENRRILKQLLQEGRQVIERDVLIGMGFRMSYVTRVQPDRQGHVCYYCYDLAYIPTGEEYLNVFESAD